MNYLIILTYATLIILAFNSSTVIYLISGLIYAITSISSSWAKRFLRISFSEERNFTSYLKSIISVPLLIITL